MCKPSKDKTPKTFQLLSQLKLDIHKFSFNFTVKYKIESKLSSFEFFLWHNGKWYRDVNTCKAPINNRVLKFNIFIILNTCLLCCLLFYVTGKIKAAAKVTSLSKRSSNLTSVITDPLVSTPTFSDPNNLLRFQRTVINELTFLLSFSSENKEQLD